MNDSERKPNKKWVDKGSKFYNSSMKSWLQENDIEIFSTRLEGKSVVAVRFIRTLKTKIYKYITSISKNVRIDKLNDIVNKYNNTNQNTIKMKPVDLRSSTFINFGVENNDNDPKFEVDDCVRIWKYKSIFTKVDTSSW